MGFETEALPWEINVGTWNGFSATNLRSRMEKVVADRFDWAIFPLFDDQQIESHVLDLDSSSIPCE